MSFRRERSQPNLAMLTLFSSLFCRGVRSYWPHPVLFGLRLVDAELIVEDHELSV